MKLLVVAISVLCLLSACAVEPDYNQPKLECESEVITSATVADHTEAVQDFGVRIFQEVVKVDPDENTVLSPLSIYSALLLAYEGSACTTKEQIMETLGLGEGNENVLSSTEYLNFINELMPTEDQVTFTYANALFSDPNRIEIADSYKAGLEQDYMAETATHDFGKESTLDAINSWAEENTNGKIKKVLEEISGDEIAFLLNAIYFSGDWLNGFDEQVTFDKAFQLKDGTTVNVPTMIRDAASNFFEDDNYKIVDMDIKVGDYAVSFLTSSQLTHIDDLLLNDNFYSDYQQLLTKLQSGRLVLSLPKFELEGNKQLKGILLKMGMSDAFSQGSANFSRMGTAGGNIFLTRVMHDTYIKVDEKGIEGAAVTTIGVGTTSVPPPMDFNKAFAFVLRHKATGVPIFIGKVENPLE